MRRNTVAIAAAIVCGGFVEPAIGMSRLAYIRAGGPCRHLLGIR